MGRWRLYPAALLAELALWLRLRAGRLLPLDFDEPVYARAAGDYARALRREGLAGLAHVVPNPEHPALLKVMLGGVLVLLGPDTWWFHGVGAGRALSILHGTLHVGLVAWLSPGAGLLLALHTLHAKYTAEAVLEAWPMLWATVATVLAAASGGDPGRRGRGKGRLLWWLSAAALGLAVAGKYAWGLVILPVFSLLPGSGGVCETPGSGTCRWRRWVRTATAGRGNPLVGVVGYGLLAAAVFWLLDPALWEDPLQRLGRSVAFHPEYAREKVLAGAAAMASGETGPTGGAGGSGGWGESLARLFMVGTCAARRWHPGVFPLALDPALLALGLAGAGGTFGRGLRARLRRGVLSRPTFRRRLDRAMGTWLVVSAAFLAAWPLYWPHYALLAVVPLAWFGGTLLDRGGLAVGRALASAYRAAR